MSSKNVDLDICFAFYISVVEQRRLPSCGQQSHPILAVFLDFVGIVLRKHFMQRNHDHLVGDVAGGEAGVSGHKSVNA
jgi:hypothetical protein